jgi:SAM-dependent methyltransferase
VHEAASPAPELDRRTLSDLREALRRAGYTQRNVAAALGRRAPFPAIAVDVYVRRLPEDTPLSTLIRLFHLGRLVPVGDATRALDPVRVATLENAGVLELNDGQVSSPLALTPFAGLVLLHDRDDRRPLAASHVAGVAPASKSLVTLTVRRPVDSALDVGTGCGVQALLAARHARRVVAVDLNPRALGFARMNAALNRVDHVEFREGDLFEPVEGERFDLVVANPPYVISPDSELLFRDGGLARDELSRRVLLSTPDFLADDGFASMLCSWVVPRAASWSAPILEWLDECGCDVFLLRFTLDDPVGYAAKWTHDLDRWLAYYRTGGIERIALGAVVLHRPGTVRVDVEGTSGPRGSAGPQLERIFSAQRDLAGDRSGPAALLASRFQLVDGHRMEQTADFGDGRYSVRVTRLATTEGVGVDPIVDTDAVHVLARLDPDARLADVIERAARETGLERARIERAALTTLPRLYGLGFAERVG